MKKYGFLLPNWSGLCTTCYQMPFKYTAPGDYVQLTASLQEEDQQTFVHISVKDSGRGIPDGVKDRNF